MKRLLILSALLQLLIFSPVVAQISFPFFDDVENDSLSRTYWRPDSATWNITVTAGHSGIRAWQYSPTTTTYKWLTLAGTLNLSTAANPYLSFWIRQTQNNNRGFYRVQISNDGGASWTDLINATSVPQIPWTRLQASLANYRQPNVLIRIGVIQSSSSDLPTFQIDDVLIDNAPTPTFATLTNATNNGMRISWGQSTASDFYKYRVVLSTNRASVDTFATGSYVTGRTERRAFDVFTRTTVETTLTDLVFTNTTYYAKVYEEDTQGFFNQGTDRVDLATRFDVTTQVAPFVQDFEGTFQWAADVPWAVTTADSAEPGHSPTHAYEDSPESNYPPNADRRLVFATNLNATPRPALRFKHRYGFEYGKDFGWVDASLDNTNWTTVGIFTGSWASWREEEFDIAAFRGNPAYIRFRTTSNATVQLDGWHLDDVEIYNNTRTSAFPFFDDVEVDSITRQKWIAGNWRPDGNGRLDARSWRMSPTTTTYQWLTLAGTLNLSTAANPYLSFWIRQTQNNNRGFYRVQISNDGGASWTDLINATSVPQIPWTRLQASLANYRQPNVLIRIGVIQSSSSDLPTFQIDDVLIDNAPTPTFATLTNATNNGMRISWGQSTASDFYKYRVVLSTNRASVDTFATGSYVTGRTERRAFDVFTRTTVETTLTDLVFTNTTYYAKVYEEDTQGFFNQGTDRVDLATRFDVTTQVAPFVQDFEGTFQWAADVPWAVTTADSAEPGHSPTHAYEDSPESNYPPNADRRLVFATNLNATPRPALRFKHRYGFEYGKDFGWVDASLDNTNWTTVGIFTGSWASWREEEFDIAAFRGNPAYIRFRTTSNATVQLDGWHLDDVEIYNNTRTSAFPFFDDVEVDSITRQKWIAGNWRPDGNGRLDARSWRMSPTTTTYQWLTLAGTLNLSTAANPYLSFWIRQTQNNNRGFYRVQISNDGGASWTDLINATSVPQIPWTRLQASLANYRQPNVLIRIGVIQSSSSDLPTFQIDDVLITDAPTAPILVSPVNNATNQPRILLLQWNPVSGAVTYHLQLATDSLFTLTSLVINDSSIISSSRQAGPLQSTTTYFWRVRARGIDSTSGWSTMWRFTTGSFMLATPSLIAPPNNAVQTSRTPTLRWLQVVGSDSFTVQLDTTGIFSSPLRQYSTNLDSITVRDTLLYGQRYFWRVMARRNAGGTSDWTSAWNFQTIIAVPNIPILISPTNGAINQPTILSLRWGRAQHAESYRIQLSTDSLFTTTILDDSTLTDTLRQVGPLTNLTKYYWHVRAKNISGISSYSETWNFTTVVAAPAVPVLASPPNGSVGNYTTLTLSWRSAARAENYRLQVALDTNFVNLVVNDSLITDTTRLVTGLNPLTTYYWHVNARNAGGTSAYSERWSFRTLGVPTTVTLVSPPNNAINQPLAITFVWRRAVDQTLAAQGDPATGGHKGLSKVLQLTPLGAEDSYPLALETITNYWFERVTDTISFANLLRDTTLTDTTKTLADHVYLTTYYWRVRAKNEIGWGQFSPWWRFTTIIAVPAIPLLASPANGAVNQPITLALHWHPAARAESYHLQVSTDSLFNTTVVNDSTLTDTLRQVGPLANFTKYYWRVRAKNVGGASAYSEIWNLTTIIAAPPMPVLASPANGAVNQPITLALHWHPAARAESYHLQVSTDSLFNTTVVNDSTLTDTLRQVGPLANFTKYYWRVRAGNMAGWGSYSQIWSFTTIVTLPSQVLLISPADSATVGTDSVVFLWQLATPQVDRYWFEIALDSLFNFRLVDSTLTDTTTIRRQLINNQTYWWRVRAHNPAGWGQFSNPRRFRVVITSVAESASIPKEYLLHQNYPNPFNPSTTIRYELPRESRVVLKVFNMLGQEVATLVNEEMKPGSYKVTWDATGFPSGVYFYRLRAGEFIETKKLLLLR